MSCSKRAGSAGSSQIANSEKAAIATRVAAMVRSARARENRYGASAIATIVNRLSSGVHGWFSALDDLPGDVEFPDPGPLTGSVAREDVHCRVDEM